MAPPGGIRPAHWSGVKLAQANGGARKGFVTNNIRNLDRNYDTGKQTENEPSPRDG